MRQSNLELCRIVSILLVVLVHANYAWQGLANRYQYMFYSIVVYRGLRYNRRKCLCYANWLFFCKTQITIAY